MSLSEREIQREAPDGAPFMSPTAAPPYEPDLEAFLPDPRNDKIGILRKQLKDNKIAPLTLSTATPDGQRERFTLSEADTKAYLEASLAGDVDDRDNLVSRRIFENRLERAITAHERIVRAGKRLGPAPEDEAALREFGGVVTRTGVPQRGDRQIREYAVGEGDDAVTQRDVLRPGFVEAATRAIQGLREGKTIDRIREDDGFWDGYNTGAFGAEGYYCTPGEHEYLPRGGPTFRQQLVSNVWDAQAKCYYAWTHDPVIREGCAILTEFPLGRGVQLIAKDSKLQNFLDAFTKRTKLDRKLRVWTNTLSRDGELFIRKLRDGAGAIAPVALDMSTIWELVCDGEDVDRIFYYVQQYQTRYQYDSADVPDAQIRLIRRTIAADDVVHVKINADAHDVRGRSDIFPALGWGKRLRDYADAEVQKSQAHAAYQWIIKVNGGTSDVSRIAAQIPGQKPSPGSSWVVNKQVEVDALASGATGGGPAGQGSTYELLLNQVALAFGLPKDYFGVSSRGSRATALVAADPASKRFEDRQNVVKSEIVEPIIDAAIQEARAHGLLDGVKDFSWRASFPAIIKADAATRSTLLRTAKGEGVLSHKTMATELIGELDMEDYDYDAEMASIEQEIGVAGFKLSAKDSESVKRGLPDKDDAAFDPGEVPNPAMGAVGGPAAGDAGDASPSSATGAAKIHGEVGAHESKRRARLLAEAARIVSAAGGVVILP
jgi:hypothetical protein